MKTLTEFIAKKHLTKSGKVQIKYHPRTKEELIKSIRAELKADNCNLNCIDTSNVTDMLKLFDQSFGIYLTEEQQKSLDVSQWDVSKVTSMMSMFEGCIYFNCNLSSWDVSSVKDMSYMFFLCESFNQDISSWDVSNVEKMNAMFWGCDAFNQDLSSWDVSNVKKMTNIFRDCISLKNKPSWAK